MRILVTGCAGFIGWKVSEFLLAEGHAVVGVDNLNHAYDVRLKEWRLAQLQNHPNFTFHRIDITDRPALRILFGQGSANGGVPSSLLLGSPAPLPPTSSAPFDAVINLAARAGVRQSVEDPWSYYETNVTGTLNLLELCREHGLRKFILASTSSVYGADAPRPFREDADLTHPLSPYAASKVAAEALCHTYHHLYGLDVIVLRYFTVYGPAGRPDMSIFRFVRWLSEGQPVIVYGDGTQARDFTYVDDIARGTLAALRLLMNHHAAPLFQTINLGSDRPVLLRDVIQLVEELAGRKAQVEHRPRHPADVPATWADITRARQLLGWEPLVSFEEGLRRTVAWYRENRDWAAEVGSGE